MEPPQRRDIKELLVNGYFKTSRARSPTGSTPTTNSPSLLHAPDHAAPRSRSRSQEPRRRVGPRPPRPTVEDEAVSLSRESSASSKVISDDPPLRGIIDQFPIIQDADVSQAEAERLHALHVAKEEENPERRFVFIPQTDEKSDEDTPRSRGESVDPYRKKESARDGGERLAPRPLERRPSRQDLPSLVTKAPRDIPPQFRRSTSATGPGPRDCDVTPRPPGSRTPGVAGPGEYLLSPDVPRGKDYFGNVPAPRNRGESIGARNGTPVLDKRRSGGSIPGGPRSNTPSDKRNSGNFEQQPRSRRGTGERMTRPQQLSEEEYRRSARHERHASTHSTHLSTGSSDHRRARSPHSRHHQSTSESDITDSEPERERRHRHRHHRHQALQVDDGPRRSSSRSNRSSLDPKSRYSNSPLPSPKVSPSQLPTGRGPSPRGERERAETYPQRSGSRSPISRPASPFSAATEETPRPFDRLNPMDSPARPARSRSRVRQSHSVSTPTSSTPSSNLPTTLPIAIPSTSNGRPTEPQRLPSFPPYDERQAPPSRPAESSSYWQPPQFQPPANTLGKPVGTFRRYSEDLESGSIAPLPTCPRTKFTRGRNDWLTLPGARSFDICPSCFTNTMAPTEFRGHFMAAPRRNESTEVLCDFGSSPWYRIAWLLTRKERRKDLNLFYGLAHIADTVTPCAGKAPDCRQWYSLIDHKTRTPVQNFDVCSSCVKSVEVLLPPLRGIFVKTPPTREAKVCDLHFDSKRFIQYFDALETTADRAVDDGAPPDTRSLVSLTKRLAAYPECQRSTDLIDAKWNVITQLPEFTVCEECFEDVVWPEVEEEKAVAMMFGKEMRRMPRASCQLYSPKMRGIFRTACDGDDYKLLARMARERKGVEMAWKGLKKGGSQFGAVEAGRVEDEWRRWE